MVFGDSPLDESLVGELSWLDAKLLLLSLFTAVVDSFSVGVAVFAFGGGS